MVCTPISGIESISDFLVWPTTCSYYFYLIIFGTLFTIIAWVSYKAEKDRTGTGDMIPSLGVGSIAISSLAAIGTLVKNTQGIPMVQSSILLYVVAATIVFVLIWIFKD